MRPRTSEPNQSAGYCSSLFYFWKIHSYLSLLTFVNIAVDFIGSNWHRFYFWNRKFHQLQVTTKVNCKEEIVRPMLFRGRVQPAIAVGRAIAWTPQACAEPRAAPGAAGFFATRSLRRAAGIG